MDIKLASRQFNKLSRKMRNMLDEIRSQERYIMNLCVNKARMSRKIFINSFLNFETNLDWVASHKGKNYFNDLNHYAQDIQRAQKKLISLQEQMHMTIAEIKEVNFHCKKIYESWFTILGSHSRRKYWFDESG
jgi:RNA polymerase primary sigma factor